MFVAHKMQWNYVVMKSKNKRPSCAETWLGEGGLKSIISGNEMIVVVVVFYRSIFTACIFVSCIHRLFTNKMYIITSKRDFLDITHSSFLFIYM